MENTSPNRARSRRVAAVIAVVLAVSWFAAVGPRATVTEPTSQDHPLRLDTEAPRPEVPRRVFVHSFDPQPQRDDAADFELAPSSQPTAATEPDFPPPSPSELRASERRARRSREQQDSLVE